VSHANVITLLMALAGSGCSRGADHAGTAQRDGGESRAGMRPDEMRAGEAVEPRPYVLHSRFGCSTASDCRMPGAQCHRAPLIGKCSCRADADCAPAELCNGSRCELRCFLDNLVECPRGGQCDNYNPFCDDEWAPGDRDFDLTEWEEKRDAAVPGHEGKFLHATYDEWSGLATHLRVSFRGDGTYVIEIDGLSGWNRSFAHSRPSNAKGRELLQRGTLRGKGGTPFIHSLHNAPSCFEYHSEFRAELVLVAEFASLMAYRGLWTHPKCPGFPSEYVDSIWRFVEKETGGALVRFDRTQWGDLPPTKRISATDARRLPCWPGQQWDGTACTGLPTSCPPGWQRAAGGCAAPVPSP
jgi:hypothetical protein